jgi:hypothetical protein
VLVEEGETDRPAVAPDNQRNAARLAPVERQVRVRLEQSSRVELEGRRALRLQLGEVVLVELHQAFEQRLLRRRCGLDGDGCGHG